MNAEQLKAFESFVQEAMQKTLPQAGIVRVRDAQGSEIANWSDSIMVSIVSFQSEHMLGSALMGCDDGFLEKTYPHFNPADPDRKALLHDWLGELSNLVIGRLKNILLPYGVMIKVNPPSVTEASEDIFASYATRKDNLKLWFSCAEQLVCLAFSMDVAASINFAADFAGHGHELQPGDAIYRLNEPEGAAKKYDVITQIRSGVMTDDDAALHDDFASDFDDDTPVPSSHRSLNAMSLESTLVQPQSQPNPNSSPIRSVRRSLEAIAWGEPGELCLSFQGGHTVRLFPANLLAKGTESLLIEGYRLEIQPTSQGIRVSMPELQISMEAATRAA